MKLLATILLLTISMLTVAPISQIYSPKEECSDDCCSSNNDNSQEQKGPDCCPSGICNPFQICSCCATIPSENTGFQFKIYLTETKNRSMVDKFTLSDYTRDYWQPPETTV